MKILLVNPPCGPKTIGMRHISRIEPLGLEQIGAGVSDRHQVRLVDMLCSPQDLPRTLREFAPDVVGVTTEAVRFHQALAALGVVRQAYPRCLTVVGGHHATIFPSEFDDPAVDLLVQGEGLQAFRKIVETVEGGGRSFDHIPGLMIRDPAGGLRPTAPRPAPTTLDDQPFPDRRLTAPYRKRYYYITEPSAAGMRTSMGCRFACSFCPNPLYAPGSYLVRDPQLLLDEIRTIQEPFIFFCDNGSFHDVQRMAALGEMLLKSGIRKRYLSYVRADTIVNHPELFELWARAGLSIAMVGLEALSDDALCRFNKGCDFSHNERAVRFLEKLGISISAGFVVNPEDGSDDFRRVDRYIRSHPSILHAEFTPLTPFPGTKYFESQSDRVLTADWEVYDMMHFVVRTRLSHYRLYRMMLRSYRAVGRAVFRRERMWLPHRGFRRHNLKLLGGLLSNAWSIRCAHRHVPAEARPEDLDRLRRLSAAVASARAARQTVSVNPVGTGMPDASGKIAAPSAKPSEPAHVA